MILDRVLGQEHQPGHIAGVVPGDKMLDQLPFPGSQPERPCEQVDPFLGRTDLDGGLTL